jgi:hypothetical protein
MTGLEHYRAAEQLLEQTREPFFSGGKWRPDADRTIAAARVHAMLAAVAVSAAGQWPDFVEGEDQ